MCNSEEARPSETPVGWDHQGRDWKQSGKFFLHLSVCRTSPHTQAAQRSQHTTEGFLRVLPRSPPNGHLER